MNGRSAIEKLARPAISEMCVYEPMEPRADAILLHANEAPDKNGEDQTHRLNRYPSNKPQLLISRMASFYDVASENVLVTRGSSEGIDLTLRTFCTAGCDNVLLSPPTFEMYKVYASLQGAEIKEVPLRVQDGFSFDVKSVLSACDDNTKLIFLCSPNNPDGSLISQESIEHLLVARAEKSIVVVDEAYIEFSNTTSITTLVNDYENLVVLRTLSKAFALAGARCGAIVASTTLIKLLSCALPPYAVSSLVADRAATALDDVGIETMQKTVKQAINERQRVQNALDRCQAVARSWPSEANFLLVQFEDLTVVLNVLRAQNILIREFPNDTALKNCARITIASSDENEKMLRAIRGIG